MRAHRKAKTVVEHFERKNAGHRNVPLRRIVNNFAVLQGGETDICGEVQKLSRSIDDLKKQVDELKLENESLMNNAVQDSKYLDEFSDVCTQLGQILNDKCK